MKVGGIRRRVVLVGDGSSLARLYRQLAAVRGGIEYEFVGVVSREGAAGLPLLGASVEDLAAVLEATRPDELLLAEAAYDERTVLDIVQQAHRQGVKVRLAPNTTELLVHEGEYVPGQGVPLFELRPPILTGVDWAVKRLFDVVVSAVLAVVLAAALAPRGTRHQARHARPGALRRPAHRAGRAGVRHAQVPHHGGRTRRSGNRTSKS